VLSICHVTTVHPRDDVRIFFKECLSLVELTENPVTLLVADGKGSKCSDGVEIVDVGKPGFGRVGRAVLGNVRIWRALRSLKPDVVHLHDPELLFLGAFLHARKRVVVYDMHEDLPKQILTKEWLPKYARGFISWLVSFSERVVLPWLPVVFAELSYKRDYPWIRNSEVVLNLPRLDFLNSVEVIAYKRKTIGYIGGVSQQRGAIVTLEAMRALREEGFDMEFLCIGEVDPEIKGNDLFLLAQREGWARFTGRVIPTDGWKLLSGCVLGLAILAPSPNYLDSYPTKIFEYMALGMPVIVSDFPLYREIVESSGCGLWVDPLNLKAVCSAIRWLLQHPLESMLMGQRGRKAVNEKYSWGREAEKLVAFYRRLDVA